MARTQAYTDGISLSGLVKSYGSVQAVRGVDISISAGETVALLGPNGAGKSTTIDMMLGLAQSDAGAASIFGLSPADAVQAGLIGGMLQTGSLIQHLSVRELITMVGSLYPDPLPVEQVLEVTQTAEFAHRQTTKLSGGQTQRVRFALVLVANPALLVLDEPTAALDVEGRRGLLDSHEGNRRERQDDSLCDSLPRGGRRLRRPDRPHGQGTRGGRRSGDGNKGEGGGPYHPGHAPRSRRRHPSVARGSDQRRPER